MLTPEFDTEAVFDASDYRYFYDILLTAERTEQDVALIWSLLDLAPEVPILDLACGHGRIANHLASRGCVVTGLDITPSFLDQARQEAADLGISVTYVQGDMRVLPWSNQFERVVSWFTSFGYFDDNGNRAVLREAYRALKPGGRILLELNNRDLFLKTYQQANVVEREGNYLLDRSRFDILTGRNYTERIVLRDGRVRRFHFFVRFFTYTEISDWLRQAGFSSVTGYGCNGNALDLDSPRMIVIATK